VKTTVLASLTHVRVVVNHTLPIAKIRKVIDLALILLITDQCI